MTNVTAPVMAGISRSVWRETAIGRGMTKIAPATTTQPVEGRVARKRLKRIETILQVAARELAERGYNNTSLEDVAERMDLAKASLYHYFDSKEALFSACLETIAKETLQRFGELAGAPGTPLERLRSLILEDLRITTNDHPELSQLFLRPMDWPPAIAAQVRGWRAEHDAIYSAVIDEGIATGELSTSDPYVARHCLHGALNYAPVWLRGAGVAKSNRLRESIADQLLAMLHASPK
jgi:AcrR family transcriptional regulator